MEFSQQLLAHTPFWVYLLLAYLVWQGIRALQPQVVTLRRIMLVPVLFMLSGIATLVSRKLGTDAWIAWGIALLLFVPFGLLTGPRLLAVDADRQLVRRVGSAIPLIRNVGVFVLQYVFAVIAAKHPDSHSLAVLAGRAVSGATGGYFLGWLAALRGHYRTAPRVALEAA